MNHPVTDRETWLKERMALLRREKTVTRELDLLAQNARSCPGLRLKKPICCKRRTGQSLLMLYLAVFDS